MRLASVHGRFQPFHNGHLSYVLCALERVDFIYVGITRLVPDGIRKEGSSQLRAGLHSATDESNPFSFFQRRKLVEAGLSSAGVGRDRFDIIPFPIETPEELPFYFPRNGLCYTTVKDEWNLRKVELLRRYSYQVEIIENIERHGFTYASGSQIRAWAQAGDEIWRSAVPAGVSQLLPDWKGEAIDVDVSL